MSTSNIAMSFIYISSSQYLIRNVRDQKEFRSSEICAGINNYGFHRVECYVSVRLVSPLMQLNGITYFKGPSSVCIENRI